MEVREQATFSCTRPSAVTHLILHSGYVLSTHGDILSNSQEVLRALFITLKKHQNKINF